MCHRREAGCENDRRIRTALAEGQTVFCLPDVIDDHTYRPPATQENLEENGHLRSSRIIFDIYGWPDQEVDYWRAVSLTENIEFMMVHLQIHHAEDDPVVNIGYSFELTGILQVNTKVCKFLYL